MRQLFARMEQTDALGAYAPGMVILAKITIKKTITAP